MAKEQITIAGPAGLSSFGGGGFAGAGSGTLGLRGETLVVRQYRGIEWMRKKLLRKRPRVLTRYKFYEMKNLVRDFGISTPPEMRAWNSALGWCAHAVDDLADRMVFREFRGDIFDLNSIYRANNQDVLFDSAILSALIAACCFLRVYKTEDGAGIEVLDGANATGEIDERTGLLREGYAVLSRDESQQPVLEAWFTAEETRYYERGKLLDSIPHVAGAPLLVPVIYRPDAARPFGHSRISRACMDHAASAIRTIKRSEISAEFFSFPQKYATGLAQDFDEDGKFNRWKAAMSSFWTLTKDQDGDKPTVGQFQQQSMEPHLAQLRFFASLFAGETSLTLDDLGFPSDNPSSQEAIKAAHENLRLKARKAQRNFGVGFLNAGLLAARVRDNYAYSRAALSMVKPVWEPVFEPDASGLNLIGDGVLKLNTAVPGFVDEQTMEDLTGIRRGGEA